MAFVYLQKEALDRAIRSYEDLETAIDYFRNWCIRNSPVPLPSLAEGTTLTQNRDWFGAQVKDLTMLRDLARLLEEEGGANIVPSVGRPGVSYPINVRVASDGSIDSMEALLGQALARRAQQAGAEASYDNVSGLNEVLDLVERYQNNETVSGAFHDQLGPQGLVELTDVVHDLAVGVPTSIQNGPGILAVQERFGVTMATSLAAATGEASQNSPAPR